MDTSFLSGYIAGLWTVLIFLCVVSLCMLPHSSNYISSTDVARDWQRIKLYEQRHARKIGKLLPFSASKIWRPAGVRNAGGGDGGRAGGSGLSTEQVDGGSTSSVIWQEPRYKADGTQS